MSELLLINPRRKRKMHRNPSRRRTTKMRRNPIRRHRRRVTRLRANPKRHRRVSRMRHNPIIRRRKRGASRGGSMNMSGFLKGTLMPSAIGAGGALGVDLLLGFAAPMLPAMLTTPAIKPFVRLAAAIGLGLVAGKVGGRAMGEKVTAGAVTVIVYDTVKGFLQTAMPTLPLSGMDAYPNLEYYNAGTNVGAMGMYQGPASKVAQPMGMYTGNS